MLTGYATATRLARSDNAPTATALSEPAAAPSSGETGSKGSSDLAHRLSSGSVWALVVYVGGAGLTSVAQFEIARLVGLSSYGTYSYAFAWVSLLAYSATLGFNVALLRFVPAYGAKGEWSLARGVIQFAVGWTLVAAIVLAGIGTGIVAVSSARPHSELSISLLIGMATVPLVTMYLIGATLLRAFGGIVSALLPERIVRDGLLLVLVVLAATAASWRLDAALVMAALLISSAVTVGVVCVIMRQLWPLALRGVSSAYAPRYWLTAVFPIMIMTAVDTLMNRTGVMLLGWTGNIRDAGTFAVGFNVAMLLLLPRVAVSTVFAPTIADLHARGDRLGLQALFARASVLSFVGAVMLAVPLLVVLEPGLRWFGKDFVAAVHVAQILMIGQVFAAAAGPHQNLLTMTGHERAAAVIMVASAAANVAACAIGIALYGAIGAAVATTATMVLWNVATGICVYRRLDLIPGLAVAMRARRNKPVHPLKLTHE
ncbi:lipopolysaccharide biosynthesis protein [Bosea sp. 2YAB26]|uniref:lipopolysaccharide biosynthesis protein n=1 Tax=Bosea sp. 2YAB26 TaxID=3237478 RepID=UPI003F903CEA